MSVANILKQKKYPSQYPADAVKVLNAMSFSRGERIKIVGSQSLQSQTYAGDYDAYEVVEGSEEELVKGFQAIIRTLRRMKHVYIGDIKAGVIEEWNVDVRKPAEKIERLLADGIISKEEAKADPKTAKFHIIRWTPDQVLKGRQTLRDGRTYTLKEAFHSPTITKLDVVALVDKRYTEFSIIYEFRHNGKILNKTDDNPEKSLRDDIKLYQAEGNFYKALKRKFSLAKLLNKAKDIKRYSDLINSETGKLYTLYSDVKTLADLLERTDINADTLRQAINNFSVRLRNIYADDIHLKDKKDLLLQLRSTKSLREVEERLYAHLQQSASKLR
jgi:hypothetical protein